MEKTSDAVTMENKAENDYQQERSQKLLLQLIGFFTHLHADCRDADPGTDCRDPDPGTDCRDPDSCPDCRDTDPGPTH